MTNEIIFRRKLRDVGNVLGVSIPLELLEFLEAKKDDKLNMTARVGKSGKGICIWRCEDEDLSD